MAVEKLTFFHADFGKEFPSRNLWRGPSRNCPSPSSALCPFSTEQSTFRGGEGAKICRGKGRRRGGQERGQKGKKDAQKKVRKPQAGRHYKMHLGKIHLDNLCTRYCQKKILTAILTEFNRRHSSTQMAWRLFYAMIPRDVGVSSVFMPSAMSTTWAPAY